MREAIEKGVPNVNVQMEGENLKIVVPRPTTEAREGLIKLAKNHAEQVLSFFHLLIIYYVGCVIAYHFCTARIDERSENNVQEDADDSVGEGER